MSALNFAGPVPQPDRELYLNGRGMRAAQLGPFSAAVKIRVRAYGYHRKTGDSPTASLVLLYNGDGWGNASDASFDRASLQVLNHLVLDPGESAAFAIQSHNTGAAERYVGLDFWLSAA